MAFNLSRLTAVMKKIRRTIDILAQLGMALVHDGNGGQKLEVRGWPHLPHGYKIKGIKGFIVRSIFTTLIKVSLANMIIYYHGKIEDLVPGIIIYIIKINFMEMQPFN